MRCASRSAPMRARQGEPDVEQGTILALLGPDGAGKTTMVRILSTLIPADAGFMGIWSSRLELGSSPSVRSRLMPADSPSHSRPAPQERVAARILRLFNPLARRLIAAGVPTGAPNVLLIVRGRRSGIERTTPVGMLDLDGQWFVQASYGTAGWARNLRAAGEATVVHPNGHRTSVQAIELPPDEAGAILRRALESFRQLRLLRALLGSRWRPPVALLRRYRIRIDDTPQDYVDGARRHPLFQLRPNASQVGMPI